MTNLLTFDRGRPLHVFDAKKIKGDLTVRRARVGEELLALDGRTYALDEFIVAICDEAGPELLAGLMGGEASGCDEGTTEVLIETALWDPANIAKSGRKLGIVTDARYRFERGVDPTFALPGLELATQLILQFCGGEPSEIVLAGAVPGERRRIDFPYGETKRLAGVDITPPEADDILSGLAFPSSTPARPARASRSRPGGRTLRARPTSSRKSCASPASSAFPRLLFLVRKGWRRPS